MNFTRWIHVVGAACTALMACIDAHADDGIDVIRRAEVGAESPVTFDRSPTSRLSVPDGVDVAAALSRTLGHDIVIAAVSSTGSMRPYFDENSLLLLEAAPYSELKVGDVVTYYHAGLKLIVVHRLLEKRGDFFWAHGDHNSHMDSEYVTPENYQRRLVGVIYLQPHRGTASIPASLAGAALAATAPRH